MATSHFWKHYVRPRYKRLRLRLLNQMPTINSAILQPSANRRLYAEPSSSRGCNFAHPGGTNNYAADRLTSCLCTEAQLTSTAFRYWIDRTGASFRMHRKLWEHAYILQALYERGLLRTGVRGLGFAVGEEPLPRILAEYGCEVVATDLDKADERSRAWRASGQHMSGVGDAGAVVPLAGAGSVAYRNVDMNRIPADLHGFDFAWSTCSFEHCGSIGLGQEFIWNQMRCLKPGGVAIHTTEFNLTSDNHTIEKGATVIFRRQDVETIINSLLDEGHDVEPLVLDPGAGEFDRHIDWPPFSTDRHLRLTLKRYAATSIGLIIRKSSANARSLSA